MDDVRGTVTPAHDDGVPHREEWSRRVLESQERLRALITANRAMVDELDLERVLRTIVQAAVDLVHARYGALGVIGQEGGLERFIHVGGDADMPERIGHYPRGHGLLGALIDDPRPIRLEHLSSDDRSSGFPAGHPPMDSFLGVPIRVRDEVFGNLYLTEHGEGGFSAEDEELLIALAATAGVAIDNARLFQETRRRQQWSAASAQIAASLLSGGRDDALSTIAETTAQLADADVVCVVLPHGARDLVVDTVGGIDGDRFRTMVIPREGSTIAAALDSGAPVRRDDLGAVDTAEPDAPLMLGPSMIIPLIADDTTIGALAISRLAGRRRFSDSDLELASDFADQCAIALALERGRVDREKLSVLQDRGRIARDLHDHVIQRLFGAGLTLQAVGSEIEDARLRERVEEQVTALDEAIGSIRTAIFALTSRRPKESVKHRIMDVVTAHDTTTAPAPRLILSGPIDSTVTEDMVADVLAVVSEGVANVARHAQASSSTVSVSVEADRLVIRVEDDGVGPGSGSRRSGTANLEERAARWGGSSHLRPRDPNGSVLDWTIPLHRTTGRRA
ncbi:signal transduction histidine kinase [Labedella gwakjiensis]|uniref:GAF domain-containing protein n=1 Tax=Labedella gwakjiensis TaxID=390269 RepID=A0A2P8GT69_9MICO|nr:GAF domain-containing protein [Labedella gwakjiensis]PSL37157.1 signal transduction histidine kinase [Labedella gwakjiensis]RUQ81944.1 GAF domain-containing protein [Labedella gwakjiensis]